VAGPNSILLAAIMTIFTNMEVDVAKVKSRINGVILGYLGCMPADEIIEDALLAAEGDVKRKLRVFLEPTWLIPPSDLDSVPALDEAGTAYELEPGYDYDPSFFEGEKWGLLVTRQNRIIQVTELKFVYPLPLTTVWSIPMEWLRIDNKYGRINLVPSTAAFSAPLSVYIMNVLGGGRTIPQMLHCKYQAGLKDVRKDWPDIISTLYRMAILRILNDNFVPQSASISADGLSQSRSLDLKSYADSIDTTLERIRQELHGVVMGFV
jgi:hypothetical protein